MGKRSISGVARLAFLFLAGTATSLNAQAFKTLVNFDGTNGSQASASLVRASNGNFYGTTNWGGENGGVGNGTVFKVTPGGVLTTLYNFCSQTNCTDGSYPEAALVQATDGSFYGTTSQGEAMAMALSSELRSMAP